MAKPSQFMRRPVIAGNWKMFKTRAEARAFLIALKPLVANSTHCDIVIGAPHTALAAAVDAARGSAIGIAAQNMHWEKEGAFTGEVSARMIVDAGCSHIILGHSERRQFFGETNYMVNQKIKSALAADLAPIVCMGELNSERQARLTERVLSQQFREGFANLTGEQFSRIILAYEPVWAIGTGNTATPEVAAEAHRMLRGLAVAMFSMERAAALRILYGGSVKPDNIKGLMAQMDIDGALVGGASLDANSFASIVNF